MIYIFFKLVVSVPGVPEKIPLFLKACISYGFEYISNLFFFAYYMQKTEEGKINLFVQPSTPSASSYQVQLVYLYQVNQVYKSPPVTLEILQERIESEFDTLKKQPQLIK